MYGRRAIPWMIYSGVFERHPGLRVVLTETPGQWWTQLVDDLDSTFRLQQHYADLGRGGMSLGDLCPKGPSAYCKAGVFVGASFINHVEAQGASREGYWTNVLWGSDYPHQEGTFTYPDSWDEMPVTHTALQFAFGGLPANQVRAMLGENAARVYGLDMEALQQVADRINAPTMELINAPFEIPTAHRTKTLAFREKGTWG
jgi:predicted TIM-barrel fold metal-dependent hydrolase